MFGNIFANLKARILARRERARKAFVRKTREMRRKEISDARGIKTMYSTGAPKAYRTYGRNFEEHLEKETLKGRAQRDYTILFGKDHHYEANQGISIRQINPNGEENKIAWLNLGFTKDALIIEAMQTNRGLKPALNEFRRASKELPLDFLLKKAEAAAKECGIKEVKIRTPISMYYYENPLALNELTDKEIREAMNALYKKIALRHGYQREGTLFFVKKL